MREEVGCGAHMCREEPGSLWHLLLGREKTCHVCVCCECVIVCAICTPLMLRYAIPLSCMAQTGTLWCTRRYAQRMRSVCTYLMCLGLSCHASTPKPSGQSLCGKLLQTV